MVIVAVLCGAAVVLVASFAACMFDPEIRKDALALLWTVLAAPAVPVIFLALRYARRGHRIRPLSPAAFRRVAERADLRGMSISRQGQYVLVITEARKAVK